MATLTHATLTHAAWGSGRFVPHMLQNLAFSSKVLPHWHVCMHGGCWRRALDCT